MRKSLVVNELRPGGGPAGRKSLIVSYLRHEKSPAKQR